MSLESRASFGLSLTWKPVVSFPGLDIYQYKLWPFFATQRLLSLSRWFCIVVLVKRTLLYDLTHYCISHKIWNRIPGWLSTTSSSIDFFQHENEGESIENSNDLHSSHRLVVTTLWSLVCSQHIIWRVTSEFQYLVKCMCDQSVKNKRWDECMSRMNNVLKTRSVIRQYHRHIRSWWITKFLEYDLTSFPREKYLT